MNEEILHIIINDWDISLETEEAQNILNTLSNVDGESVPFNWSWCLIDMAQFFFITTTRKDLEEHKLNELLKYVEDEAVLHDPDSEFTINMFQDYNPDKWTDKSNGAWFDIDSLHKAMWLYVDRNGAEYMSNIRPTKIEEYIDVVRKHGPQEKLRHMLECYETYENRVSAECFGWLHFYDENVTGNVFRLGNYVELPKGFIRQMTGKEMTFDDEPMLWQPVNSMTVELFNDK